MTHQCTPPAPVDTDDEWTCPDCGAAWWVDEVGYDTESHRSRLEWRRFHGGA